jgi:hypothetical protein
MKQRSTPEITAAGSGGMSPSSDPLEGPGLWLVVVLLQRHVAGTPYVILCGHLTCPMALRGRGLGSSAAAV